MLLSAQAVPYRLQPGRRGGLIGVDPAPGGDEHRVRAQLRGAGLVEDVRAALAAHRAVAAAAVAAARPRRQARAGRRQVGAGVDALAAPGLGRRDEPVRRHLGAHRRGRPAQLPRDLPARGPALQHPLDRVPLVPREPSVGPRDRPRGATLLLSGHAVLRSPGAGRSGPQGIGFPHSSAHVRMNVGGVRIKSIIKGPPKCASCPSSPPRGMPLYELLARPWIESGVQVLAVHERQRMEGCVGEAFGMEGALVRPDRVRYAVRLVTHDNGEQVVAVGEAVASRLVDEDSEFSHCSHG